MIEISEHPFDQFHLQDDISGQEQPEIASKNYKTKKKLLEIPPLWEHSRNRPQTYLVYYSV